MHGFPCLRNLTCIFNFGHRFPFFSKYMYLIILFHHSLIVSRSMWALHQSDFLDKKSLRHNKCMCTYTGRDETEPVYEGALLRRFTALSVVVLFDSCVWLVFTPGWCFPYQLQLSIWQFVSPITPPRFTQLHSIVV